MEQIIQNLEDIIDIKDLKEILTPKELEDINTIEDLQNTVTEAMIQEYNMQLKLEGARTPILVQIENLKKYLIYLKIMYEIDNKNGVIGQIIKIINNILAENQSKKKFETIGAKICNNNKDLYYSCQKQLKDIQQIINLNGDIIFWDTIPNIKELFNFEKIRDIVNSEIREYEKSIDKSKKL